MSGKVPGKTRFKEVVKGFFFNYKNTFMRSLGRCMPCLFKFVKNYQLTQLLRT